MSIISQLTQSLSKLLFSLILKMNENEKEISYKSCPCLICQQRIRLAKLIVRAVNKMCHFCICVRCLKPTVDTLDLCRIFRSLLIPFLRISCKCHFQWRCLHSWSNYSSLKHWWSERIFSKELLKIFQYNLQHEF